MKPSAASSLAWKLRRAALVMAVALVLALVSLILANAWVVTSARPRIHFTAEALPANDVALVLGTAPRVSSGRENLHFRNRIAAAAALFHQGKVRHVLVSGDNHVASYDEPTAMKESLMRLGVPESSITLDYAGFRTLDSMVRAHKVFGLTRFTVVSDDFHLERALFIGARHGLEVAGYPSARVPASWSFRSRIREWAARWLAVVDVVVLNRAPKFLGEPVAIQLADGRSTKSR